MKKSNTFPRFSLLLPVFLALCVLLTGCGAKTDAAANANAPVSPGIELLRKQAAAGMKFRTPEYEDLVFSESDFRSRFGNSLAYVVIGTLPAEGTGTLLLNGRAVLAGQTVPAGSLDFLRLIPGSAEAKKAEFTLTAKADGWENIPVRCEVAFSEHENFAPVASDAEAETLSGVACFTELSSFAADPDGDEVEYRIALYPRHGTLRVEDGVAVYRPNEGYSGKDSFVYTVVDVYGASSREGTVSLRVEENESGILFDDLKNSPAHLAAIRLCESDVMTYRKENGKYLFSPDDPVSKIDCLVMMMCLCGLSERVTAVADTEASDDAGLSSGKKGFLQVAIAEGIAHLENGKFDPASPVTAADAAYMAAKLLDLPALSPRRSFSDLDSVPDWACEAMISADSVGILSREGALASADTLDREDVAELLYRMKTARQAENGK